MRRPRKPTFYTSDSVRPPPGELPDIHDELDLGFNPTQQELLAIRIAMQIHAASRKPKLTWSGWHYIAVALALPDARFKRAAGGFTDTPVFIQAKSKYLRKTGLTFINHNERAAAQRLLPRWGEIDEWRSTLSRSRQMALNNPREVERVYKEESRALRPGAHRERPEQRNQRQFPTILEDLAAMKELVTSMKADLKRSQKRVDYYAALTREIQQEAGLTDAEIDAARARVQAFLETDPE